MPVVPRTTPLTMKNTYQPVMPQTVDVVNYTPEMIYRLMEDDAIIEFSNKLDRTHFNTFLKYLSDNYHNDQALIDDEMYDELVDIYEAKYGPYDLVGAEPTGERVDLPYYLGSLRKLKKDKELILWLEQFPGPYLIEDKIDGLTLLLTSKVVQGRRISKLYTRGGGYRGVDVSHLLSHLNLPGWLNIADTNPMTQNISVRGEIVMTKETFTRVGTGFKNARNLVSGIVNAKKQFNPAMARELSFYPYRIMDTNMTPEQEITTLQTLGFLVPNPVISNTLNREMLQNYFNLRKKEAPYEMDGLVIYQNQAVAYPHGGPPRHVVAFKTETDNAVTTVIDVIWEASKDRLLKPVIHYETINLSGADLQNASGYNARFIVTNNIGPGAKIVVTRSGDVIPRVISIPLGAPNGPAYPDMNVHGKYGWNENQVEFVLSEDNDQVIANKLRHLLETLRVKNFGPGRVKSIVEAGIRSIHDLLTVTPNQLMSIPGIGTTLANQIYDDLHDKTTDVPLARIMDASGIFPHIGERRFDAIIEVYPNLLNWAYEDTNSIAEAIRHVRGFNALADEIANKLHIFADWLGNHPMISVQRPRVHVVKLTVETQPTTLTTNTPVQQINNQTLNGLTVVFSGFRDRDMEDRIRGRGGKVTKDVSRNTSFLILKHLNYLKGKGMKAQELGVRTITKDDFSNQYLN